MNMQVATSAGGLQRDGAGWRLGWLEQLQVPDLVRQVIESRLTRLTDDARRLLEVAAIIGHDVPLDLWVEVSGEDDLALSDALEHAIAVKDQVLHRGADMDRDQHREQIRRVYVDAVKDPIEGLVFPENDG